MDSKMRFEGQVKSWNDDRGFGFVEPVSGGQELFVHIKAFPTSFGRPEIGNRVNFEVETNPDGKKRAVRIQATSTAAGKRITPRRRAKPWDTTSLFVLGGFILSYLVISLVWKLSIFVGAAYLAMSFICAVFYWVDKHSAKTGAWRISEATLLMLGVFGGWPGAIVAQHILQHKTTKPSFRIEHWATVIMNLVGFYLLTTPLLRSILRTLFH